MCFWQRSPSGAPVSYFAVNPATEALLVTDALILVFIGGAEDNPGGVATTLYFCLYLSAILINEKFLGKSVAFSFHAIGVLIGLLKNKIYDLNWYLTKMTYSWSSGA